MSSSAIYATNSKILIKSSRFNNNTARGAICAQYSNLTIDGSMFSYNNAGSGGAIHVEQNLGHKIQIDGTIFNGNTATNGGAICASAYYGDLHIQMTNTVLNFNTANGNGGAVYLLQYNSNNYIYPPQIEITLHNITAYRNVATKNDGGAVYIYVYQFMYYGRTISKQLSITESQFTKNTASRGNGGAVALHETTDVMSTNPSVFTRCEFTNNRAQNASGGAIYKNGMNNRLVISQNSYNGNTAGTFGGAIYVGGETIPFM